MKLPARLALVPVLFAPVLLGCESGGVPASSGPSATATAPPPAAGGASAKPQGKADARTATTDQTGATLQP